MSSVSIHITIEPESGRPISLAKVSDSEVLRQVARAAVTAAQAEAVRAKNADPLLGLMQDDEVSRLERYFSLLIPGYSGERSSAVR